MSHFFEWYLLGALACFVSMATGRAWLLRRRGIHVHQAPAQRTAWQKTEDFLGTACQAARNYEIVAWCLPLPFHLAPAVLGRMLVDGLPVKAAGAALWAAALALYPLALRALGDSWRIGIDPLAPPRLVTNGIFAWTRNPIYLAFLCMAVGTFLIMGRAIFLLLAVISLFLLQRRIHREEQFLANTFPQAYPEYRSRVGRYFKWF